MDDPWSKKLNKVAFIQHFQSSVGVFMPHDIFDVCPTPSKLVEYAKYVQCVMRLQESDENDFFLEKYQGKIMKKKKLAY